MNNSYYDSIGQKGAFKEGDYITAFFDDVVYTATYMGGEWIPSTNRGFSLNELSKGIGFILYVSNYVSNIKCLNSMFNLKSLEKRKKSLIYLNKKIN